MPFLKIENALATSKLHMESLSVDYQSRDEIETYLVSALVLLIISEYEELIERLFTQRAALCGDPYVCQYVQSSLAQRFRSPDLGKIIEILGKFSGDYKDNFTKRVLNTEYHSAWDNIMRARHAIVHKRGPINITFPELSLSYPKTKTVIDELKRTLGLP